MVESFKIIEEMPEDDFEMCIEEIKDKLSFYDRKKLFNLEIFKEFLKDTFIPCIIFTVFKRHQLIFNSLYRI